MVATALAHPTPDHIHRRGARTDARTMLRRPARAQRTRVHPVAHPTDPERIVQQYKPFVAYVARRVASRLGRNMDLEDLIAFGMIGLLDSARRFRPDVGASFMTFA